MRTAPGAMARALHRCPPLLCALFAALAASSAVLGAPQSPHAVALIIGNADYEHRDVPDVSFAHRDADAFRRYVLDVLGVDPDNVIDLRDTTRRELFDALGTESFEWVEDCWHDSYRGAPSDGGAWTVGG